MPSVARPPRGPTVYQAPQWPIERLAPLLLEDQPHALGYAPGIEMPRAIEAEREEVPSAVRVLGQPGAWSRWRPS